MDLYECIRRAQKGDRQAFSRLRQLYRPETAFLCARFLLDDTEAREAADAVFASMEEKLPRLKDPELFERWLSWCAARECRERLRSRAPALFTEKKGVPGTDPAARIPRKGNRIPLKKTELMDQIVEAVDGLPVLQRFPFLYCRVCGYTVEETAAFLELSAETVAFRVRSGEAAFYESVHALPGAKKAGLEDMLAALRAFPAYYIRPADETLSRMPVKREEPEETPEETLPFALPEGEPEEKVERHAAVLPLLIAVATLLLAALIFFLFWNRNERRRRNGLPSQTSVELSASLGEPGVTSIPRSAITPPPTCTPAPSHTPEPTLLPPDSSALEYVPDRSLWFRKPYRAFICAENAINVRKRPASTVKTDKLGTVSAGQEVLVYAAEQNWYMVEYMPGKLGWVSGQYVLGLSMFSDNTNENLAGITPPSSEITGVEINTVGAFEGARLYRDPSRNATHSETVEFGARVCLLSFEGDWIFVNRGGRFGWMKKEAFDHSNAMDVSNGTYYYTVAAQAVIEDIGSLTRVSAVLYRTEFLTAANAEKYIAGETVKTKNGTRLKPAFTAMEKSEREITPGVPAEISFNGGALRFVYDADRQLYQVFEQTAPMLSSWKKIDLKIRPDANVTDKRYCPGFELGTPSYGTADAAGCFLTTGDRLDDLADYVRSYGLYDGLSGTVTVRNGAVCELTIENEAQE